MKPGWMLLLTLLAAVKLASAPAHAAPSPALPPGLDETLAAVRQSLAESDAAIRGYEWVETTVVSVKGEEKSRTVQRCYYGAEGALQKTPITGEQTDKGPGGLRGRIAARKKEKLTDYMNDAVELVRHYVPVDPALLRTSREAGNASIAAVEPGKRLRLDFKYYRLPGDLLGIEIKVPGNTLAGMNVSTFLGKEKDPVSLAVEFGSLGGSIVYVGRTVLEAKAKGISVTVTNTGFLKLAR